MHKSPIGWSLTVPNMSNESVKSFTVSRNHHLFLPLMDVRDVSRLSNGKSSWCSWKPAGRLVGQPSRWHQGNSASWAAAVQPGKVTISSTTQIAYLPAQLKLPVFSEQIEFLLEMGCGNWEMNETEGANHPSNSSLTPEGKLCSRTQRAQSALGKANQTSSTNYWLQMASLHHARVILRQRKKVWIWRTCVRKSLF